ncbi:hypothetical protein [Bremerella alba]|uniref:Uncharacterized protein n=1 Tax=Bremerella alba TaxID=980252 RepID=A0A7V9A9K7_9BACT|nr:hypothetical protein [Bremerella alba]MBA2117458.1 hypothetical protein [Bremerella alba]
MRRFGSYALIATYLVVQLFGQVIHAWSGCEHAHLPGHSHLPVAAAEDHGHHHHDHGHHSQDCAEPVSHEVPGWHATEHSHGIVVDGCLLCQHLALGQMAPAALIATIDRVVIDVVVPQSTRLITAKCLGPYSPRAPPLA